MCSSSRPLFTWLAVLLLGAPDVAYGQSDLVSLLRCVRSGRIEIVSAPAGKAPVRVHAQVDAGRLAASVECGQGLSGVDRVAISCGLDAPDPQVRLKVGAHLGPIRTPLIPVPGQPLSQVLNRAGVQPSSGQPERLQELTTELCGTLQTGTHRVPLTAGDKGPMLTMEVCPATATTLEARVAARPGSDDRQVSSRVSLSRPLLLGLDVRAPGLLAPICAVIRRIKLPLAGVQLEVRSKAGRQQARIGLTVHGCSTPLISLPPGKPPSWLGQALRSIAPPELRGALAVTTSGTTLRCEQIVASPVPAASGAIDVRQATGNLRTRDTSIRFRDLSLRLDPRTLAEAQR